MSRRRLSKKRFCGCDPFYQSILIQIFVNRIMRHGKKSLSYSIIYSVLQKIQKKTNTEPLAILEHAVRTVSPTIQLKSRRVGGTNYQIPIEVNPYRRVSLAIQWIILAAAVRPGRDMVTCLSLEILDAANRDGGAVRKREEIHRIAEANKAFARYRFSVQRGTIRTIIKIF
jgi:small subunit ribosomal protein S7